MATFVPLDGQITSLPVFSGTLTGGEVQEIVSPGTAAAGVSYQATLASIASFFSAFNFISSTVITTGATLASPYLMLTTDTQILFKKTAGSPSYLRAPLAASMRAPFPVVIKDIKGDAATNPITVLFSGGELIDGASTLSINNAYGWVRINPNPGGGAWFES